MSIPEKLRQAYHNDLTDVPLLLEAADEIDRLTTKHDEIHTLWLNCCSNSVALTHQCLEMKAQVEGLKETMRLPK